MGHLANSGFDVRVTFYHNVVSFPKWHERINMKKDPVTQTKTGP
jgi:hypothetical protein